MKTMTNEEAHKYLKERYESHLFNAEENPAIRVAIYALELQIPKKVRRQFGGFVYCPICDVSEISDEYDYCPYCGKRLDWGE